jgi:hypothetical protein
VKDAKASLQKTILKPKTLGKGGKSESRLVVILGCDIEN